MDLFENRGKQEKAAVGYQEYSHFDTKMCSECANFSYPSRCAIVKGDISPDGLCSEFVNTIDKRASAFMSGFADGLKLKV